MRHSAGASSLVLLALVSSSWALCNPHVSRGSHVFYKNAAVAARTTTTRARPCSWSSSTMSVAGAPWNRRSAAGSPRRLETIRASTDGRGSQLRLIPALLIPALYHTCTPPIPATVATTASGNTASAVAGSSALAAILSLLKSGLRVPLSYISGPKDVLRLALVATLLIVATVSVVGAIGTQRRLSIDPTSEWGRYADAPAARGRALMALLGRVSPYLIAAQVLKVIWGGKGKGQSRASNLRMASGNIFADGLLRLGPLYIKIGQILSCRENLLPEEWIEAMGKLQDRVPAKSGQEALQLVHEAMPGGQPEFDRTFSEFDDVPLAAASLGQVHTARLRETDEPVAIKVQRARLRDIYDKDLALMQKIAGGVDKFGSMLGSKGAIGGVEQSWTKIFSDAETILYREIDYRDEADNAARFATDFGLGLGGKPIGCTAMSIDGNPLPSASAWMRTPYTYKELSSEKILVMEFVPSIKINDDIKLAEAGVTVNDKELLAESLARSYLRQFCTNRFFSTDPHPGNLGVEIAADDGQLRPRLVFYDFGQACALTDDQAGGILDVIEGIVDMDAKACITAFDRMGVLKDGANLEMVERKVQNNFDTGKVKVKQMKNKLKARAQRPPALGNAESGKAAESTQVSGSNSTAANATAATMKATSSTSSSSGGKEKKVSDAEVMGDFTLPAEYAFVARAISQLDGVGKGLDADFDFISAAAPHLVEVKGATAYLADEAKKRFAAIEKQGATLQSRILKVFGWDTSSSE